jgi:hypothetical protein
MKGATRGQHVAVRSVRMARFCARLFVVLALAGVSVSAQRGPIQQQLAFTPYHASGTYDVGETVGWTVTPGSTAPTYKYRWTIRRNNAVGLKEGTLDLTSGKATIEILGDQPGMIYVAIEAFEDLTPASAAPVGDGPRLQYWTQHRVVRGRRRSGTDEDRVVDAAPGGLRRLLGRQACCR